MADRDTRWAPLVLGAAFLLLTVLVALGVLDGADRALKQVFRPDDVWGPWQMRAQRFESALAPVYVLALVGAVALVVALLRRSLRPLVVAVVGLGAAGGAALLVKVLLRRPDPNLEVTGAGSYPSGHTVTLVVGVGLVLLLSVGLNRWTWPLVVLAGTAMALSLVTEGAHWTSDVVGGGLLGLVVLAVLADRSEAHPPDAPTGRKSTRKRHRAVTGRAARRDLRVRS